MKQKGFTLIDLLVVIAILAVLATVIVVIINPAELLKQARDTTRISDLAAINSAVALYLSDVTSPGLGGAANAACGSFTAKCTQGTTSLFSTNSTCTTNAVTTVGGLGWVTVDLTQISSGAPLSRLPLDPSNTGSYSYQYACNGLNYKLIATMESSKYSNATTGVARNAADGGSATSTSVYEVGNSLSL